MTNEWRAIRRVGQALELPDSELQEFVSQANTVLREKWEMGEKEYELTEEYFEFLKAEILADERIVSTLRNLDVDERQITKIKEGRFPVTGSFDTNYKFSYGLDQIVDFIMIIKLVQDYLNTTGQKWLTPRDRLHYLLYLVNHELAGKQDYSARKSSVGLGMLERTGYRYTFRKQTQGAYSKRVTRDKDRLYAWNLLEEDVDESYSPNEYQPFRLKLGDAGEILYRRHRSQLANLGSAGSELLREWHYTQKDVLERYANLSIQELREQVRTINNFKNIQAGAVLLTGRARVFDSDIESLTNLSKEIQHG